MERAQKQATVETLSKDLGGLAAVFALDYRGLKVSEATEFRRKIRETGGSYRVVKNTLTKRALEGTSLESLEPHLEGMTGLAFTETDPVALAKVLSEFGKANPELELLAGVVDGKDVIDVTGVKTLASLPGLPELRAQLLAMVQTPATQLVRLIGTPGTQIARALDARREKLEAEG